MRPEIFSFHADMVDTRAEHMVPVHTLELGPNAVLVCDLAQLSRDDVRELDKLLERNAPPREITGVLRRIRRPYALFTYRQGRWDSNEENGVTVERLWWSGFAVFFGSNIGAGPPTWFRELHRSFSRTRLRVILRAIEERPILAGEINEDRPSKRANTNQVRWQWIVTAAAALLVFVLSYLQWSALTNARAVVDAMERSRRVAAVVLPTPTSGHTYVPTWTVAPSPTTTPISVEERASRTATVRPKSGMGGTGERKAAKSERG